MTSDTTSLHTHTHTHTAVRTSEIVSLPSSRLYFHRLFATRGNRHNGRVWDGRFKSSDLFEDFSNCFPPMGTVPRDMQIDPARPALLSRFSFVAFGRECTVTAGSTVTLAKPMTISLFRRWILRTTISTSFKETNYQRA